MSEQTTARDTTEVCGLDWSEVKDGKLNKKVVYAYCGACGLVAKSTEGCGRKRR